MTTTPHSPRTAHGSDDDRDDHGGLGRDLPFVVGRRRALLLLGGAGLAGLAAACSSSDDASTTATAAATTTTGTASPTTTTTGTGTSATSDATASAGAPIPEETAGPFPADGSNGPNVLGERGVVRQDLRTSVGSASGTADGVALSIRLTVVDASTGSPVAGAAVYLWHCTADGRYSIYEVTDQNYLRGVQVTDAAGRLSFSTVFPGCYDGRWPHAHFEVYDSLDAATAGAAAVATSQLAFPQADCQVVYADDRYGSSAQHLTRQSLASDMVFRDGWTEQLATLDGSPDAGYTASLLVRV